MILGYIKPLSKILSHPLNRHHKLRAFGRVLWWKINQLFFKVPAVVTFYSNGMKCICYPNSSYGGMVIYNNLPEYPEMLFLEKNLKNDSIFIDVGANIGVYSIIAASKIKKGRVYAFEPIPNTVAILKQNIYLNNISDQVTIIEKVASDKSGKEKFNIQDISEVSHISTKDDKSQNTLIPSIRLDDFCKERNIRYIDVLKIDVEGAEMKVLKGVELYLKMNKIRILIIELNVNNSLYGSSSNEILNYLKRFNYKTYKITEDLKLEVVRKLIQDETVNIIAINKRY